MGQLRRAALGCGTTWHTGGNSSGKTDAVHREKRKAHDCPVGTAGKDSVRVGRFKSNRAAASGAAIDGNGTAERSDLALNHRIGRVN